MKKKLKLVKRFDKWEINSKLKNEKIFDVLLKNRGMVTKKQKEEFISPTRPEKIRVKDLEISKKYMHRGIDRIIAAINKKEKIVIFGDYDVDGITSTAILWEYLFALGADITPYIPERFSEGYGIKIDSILKLRQQYPKLSLVITVDNGIIAHNAVNYAKDLGIDTVIVDHHEKGEKYPESCGLIYTTKLCGAGISWFLVREIQKKLQIPSSKIQIDNFLELAALGTVADQMPLVGVNRSLVKYGLEKLNTTTRPGLNALYGISGITKGNIGVYEINYVIAPRLNAMGRLEQAMESLRLLCTKNKTRAYKLAELLNKTNLRRQRIVDEVTLRTKNVLTREGLDNIIILEGDSFHEGVIGLAASKLVEEFGRPAIVISKGNLISKGSARSFGFNINEAIAP
jgi:single-stranded-DNA-specific exonuclease